uniref:Cid3 n=1 Tax=Drosophila kanapiae TaxID=137072 RepID=A0A1V0HRM4_9MUSC|nr:Cid3 [Drosophila kanapiae]
MEPEDAEDAEDSNNDSHSFQSPEADENNTDYGLNFSSSRLRGQNGNNRRSSTLREEQQPTANHRPDSDQNSGSRQERDSVPAPRRRKQFAPLSRAARMDREIRRMRAHNGPLIPRLPFSRVVRELVQKLTHQPLRITEGALQVLQESMELYLTQRFEDAYLLTLHRGRVTLEARDMGLIAYIVDFKHHKP